MQDSGPQKVKRAMAAMEHEAMTFIAQAQALPSNAAAWQNRDLLARAREYARAVNALTRVRRISPKPSTK